jgi:hypothetical protein
VHWSDWSLVCNPRIDQSLLAPVQADVGVPLSLADGGQAAAAWKEPKSDLCSASRAKSSPVMALTSAV